MEVLDDLPIHLFSTQAGWHVWLGEHYQEPKGVWLKISKKNSGKLSVSYAEALEEALCYGWIDGQKRSYDADYFLQKFTPRRAKSTWSKVNVQKVALLFEQGRMQPSGIAAVECAKVDGRWEQAYDAASTMTMPADFHEALEGHQKAKEFYASLNKTNTYAFLWRIQTAKKPETRKTRIATFISMLSEGKTFH
jgi:uncharacterized protein YdeI (YjbR/CyaY-like superfamily)